jgi:ComF family protein
LPYSIPSSITHTTCKTCGEALPASVTRQQCGQCLKQPPAIDWLRSCFDYQYPINDWLPRLKFGKHFALADWLAHKWWQHWTQGLNQGALQHMDQEFQIIPVPLHSQRLRQRGYNQSLLIAQRLAKQLKLPLNMHCVKRHKKTQAQSGLSLKQRQRNIKQAFTVTTKPPSKVILVDDVFTTGSTINELAQTLKSAGSLYIEAWVIAHAPLHHQQ